MDKRQNILIYLNKKMKELEMIGDEEITEDMQIFTDVGITSLEILELIMEIEEEKKIVLAESDMNFADNMTVKDLLKLLEDKATWEGDYNF